MKKYIKVSGMTLIIKVMIMIGFNIRSDIESGKISRMDEMGFLESEDYGGFEQYVSNPHTPKNPIKPGIYELETDQGIIQVIIYDDGYLEIQVPSGTYTENLMFYLGN